MKRSRRYCFDGSSANRRLTRYVCIASSQAGCKLAGQQPGVRAGNADVAVKRHAKRIYTFLQRRIPVSTLMSSEPIKERMRLIILFLAAAPSTAYNRKNIKL